MIDLLDQFKKGVIETQLIEYIAVCSGILSVWFSKKENILVYPIGLINTTIYIYISFQGQLFGEATVNFYYTVMSIWGWYLWSKKDKHNRLEVNILPSDKKWWIYQLVFFTSFYVIIYFALAYLKKTFAPGAIPWADALASAAAFTGMWLMTKKKIESWYWWIITNITAIPLYFVKQYVFTSVYYFILLIMAFAGLAAWKKKFKLRTEN